MEILESKSGTTLVIGLSGRLDATTCGQLEALLLERMQAGENRLVLDLSSLQFISSAGLRVLAMALKRLSAAEGRMALCGLQKQVQMVFDISGFNNFFTIAGSLEDALGSLSQKPGR